MRGSVDSAIKIHYLCGSREFRRERGGKMAESDSVSTAGSPPPEPGREEYRALQAAAFDRIGERYDEAFPHKEGQEKAGAWLLHRLPPASRVLDAGCGTGLPTARQLADAGMAVTGIDISPV